MISTYFLTWKLFLASWSKDWTTQQKTIAQLGTHFQSGIPVINTLMWNVIVFAIMQSSLVRAAGFSADFQRFCWIGVHLPCLFGSLTYYSYKYGAKECLRALSFSSMVAWTKNWVAMQGIMLCSLTQTILFYFGGVMIQPYVLPLSWQFSLQFPADMYEEYLRVFVYSMGGLFAFCTATLPLWKRGYRLSMETAGRKNVDISYQELFMELMYQSAQSGQLIFTVTPILVALHNYAGFRVHCIHFIIAAIEIGLINYTVQFKFCILHQLMHEVKPLYAMTHIEHHICKSIHPTTSSTGLWENWVMGQSPLITTVIGLGATPWALLQIVYSGANPMVHTMWPSKTLLQWHTLHHTVLSDVYNVNIPSPYDWEHSKSVQKLKDRLSAVSVFVRYEALSDAVAFLLMGVIGLMFHYGLGIGAGHADWSRADCVFHQSEVAT